MKDDIEYGDEGDEGDETVQNGDGEQKKNTK